MTTGWGTVIGGLIIAAAIITHALLPRYEISSGSGSAVWVVDKWSGRIAYCLAQSSSQRADRQLMCSEFRDAQNAPNWDQTMRAK